MMGHRLPRAPIDQRGRSLVRPDMMAAVKPSPHVANLLRESYAEIWDLASAVGRKRELTWSAPFFVEMKQSSEEEDAALLVDMLRRSLGELGPRALDHVKSLSHVYLPTGLGGSSRWGSGESGEQAAWPRSAAFTLARGFLEGATTAMWLSEPGAGLSERLRRTLAVHRWSAHHADRAGASSGATERIAALAERTGFGPVAMIKHSKVIEKVMGGGGLLLYARWSGRAHSAPWVGQQALRESDVVGGSHFSFDLEQPEHVHLAVDVAGIAALLVKCHADYFGKFALPELARLQELRHSLAETAEYVQQQVLAQSPAKPDA